MYRYLLLLLLLPLWQCGSAPSNEATIVELTAADIMTKAHTRAGGDFWRKPQSLTLKGHGKFYQNDTVYEHERHNMWRVFEATKEQAHAANGKVRIESFRSGKAAFLVTFDGQNTYDLRGKQAPSEADKRWASNFGYGVIRHAFDEGYQLTLLADDTVKQKPIYTIEVTDPTGGKTQFGIQKSDYTIVKVAFATPRGWHERIYSDFFEKTDYNWWQSGRVELYYEGKLANEIFWTDFAVNEALPDSLFVLE